MHKYSEYNREERNLCAHLFRLLLMDHPDYGPLKEFTGDPELENPRLYTEAALLRDAYQVRKPAVNALIDEVCRIIIKQEDLSECRLYSELPDVLKDPGRTHPKQIRDKADKAGISLTEDEGILFASLQGMFNAKPDLMVCLRK